MTIIESADYQVEAEELSHKVEVEAAAIDLVLNEVDLDLSSHEGMMTTRELLANQGIHGSYIGAAGRAIQIAKDRIRGEQRLNPTNERMAHSVAVNIYVTQPNIEKIDMIYPNILEILKTLRAEIHDLTAPLKAVRTVIEFHQVVRDADTNNQTKGNNNE